MLRKNYDNQKKFDKSLKVSVIIPNYNGEKLIDDCLKSLYAQTLKPREIIIIDNASTDNSRIVIKRNYPEVKMIFLKKNKGFAYAVNLGIKKSSCSKVLILNNDTIVDGKAIELLVYTLNKKSDYIAGVVPCVINTTNGIKSIGAYVNELGQAFVKPVFTKKISDTGEVFLATGAAILCRKEIFAEIGYFEEKFFAYAEDIDWSFRAQLRGYKFVYNNKAIIFHIEKATSSKLPKLLEYLQYRNAYLFIIRCFPREVLFKRFRFIRMFATNINTFVYLVLKGFGIEALKANFWLLINVHWIIQSRKKILNDCLVSIDYIEKHLRSKDVR
ncbi:glycosyltransferase family 2 protein, partial [Patescibacteria group bacterium]|nr:glycosyltransferase family 2 protein [Patescibacteria group bacterium]